MPYILYRFMRKKEYVDAFLAGHIRISTLNACRAHEESMGGDPEEAHEHYILPDIQAEVPTPEQVEMASRAGIGLVHAADITLTNCKRTTRLHDAYVMCTTYRFDEVEMPSRFGQYCARITDPDRFFRAVTNRLHERCRVAHAARGYMNYASNSYTGLDARPGQIGFLKRPSFESEKEYRFLWDVGDATELEALDLYVPEARPFCSRQPVK